MFASETLKHESNSVWNTYGSLSNISLRLESAASLLLQRYEGQHGGVESGSKVIIPSDHHLSSMAVFREAEIACREVCYVYTSKYVQDVQDSYFLRHLCIQR